MDEIGELTDTLNQAISNGDAQSMRSLEALLVEAKATGPRFEETLLITRSTSEKIWNLVRRNPEGYRQLLRDLGTDVESWFQQQLIIETRNSRNRMIRMILSLAAIGAGGASLLSSAMSLPFDRSGKRKPRPGRIPPNLPETASTREIFQHVSELLVLNGDDAEETRLSNEDVLESQWENIMPADVVPELFDDEVSAPWREKVQDQVERLIRKTEGFEEAISDGTREAFEEHIEEPLGLTDGIRGFAQSIVSEFKHENRRILGNRDGDLPMLLGDGFLGYTLHSRFLPTTAPDHAARDNWKFFRDDREEADRPWADLPLFFPPYRKNCVCFLVPIFADEFDEAINAKFGVRISRGERITTRDVGTLAEWFDVQRPSVQQKFVGARHWFAAASLGEGGPIAYATFFRPNGTPMSINALINETEAERLSRVTRTQAIFDIQKERFFAGWDAGSGRFELSPTIEREYREKLDAALDRLGF